MQPSKQEVSIQTEFTPNPHTLKFNVSRELLTQGSVFFETRESVGEASPLAKKIFAISKVVSVLIGKDFVTVTRDVSLDTWEALIGPVTEVLREHLSGDEVIVTDAGRRTPSNEDRTEVEKKIMQILDQYIRPAVARDGGDIIFHGFKEGVVTLHLQGSCSSCPSSIATLKAGVERMLCEYVPEVKEVIQVA